MKLEHLLYISTSRLAGVATEADLARLVDRAKRANALAGISGALMFTGKRFVQLIEGAPPAIEALWAKIVADERHTDIVILRREAITRRKFQGFSLAYAGPSVFVSRNVARPLDAVLAGLQPFIGDLVTLMVEFANPVPSKVASELPAN